MFFIFIIILLLGIMLDRFFGVLVVIMLFGCRVMKLEKYLIRQGMLKIMFVVLFFWCSLLLIQVCRISWFGLGILVVLMIYGFIGVVVLWFFICRLGWQQFFRQLWIVQLLYIVQLVRQLRVFLWWMLCVGLLIIVISLYLQCMQLMLFGC